MITIGADWLRDRWSHLLAEGSVALTLSRWDAGDAFTLIELGPLPAPEQVTGRLVLAGNEAPPSPVTVELTAVGTRNQSTRDIFVAPDGTRYVAAGWCDDASGSRREMPVEIVEVANALAERRAALLESSLLADASVAIIGLGTGGIHVAVELAKAGVGRFGLVDADRLGIGNVARHHAGISQAGRRKVYVARDLILEKNPSAKIDTHPVAAGLETVELVREVVERSDLVVCATDGRPSKLFVNRVAVASARPAVFGGAFRRAYGGQVLRVRPGQSPCYQCFVMAMPEQAADQEVASPEDAFEIAYSDRPVPIEPGLSLDIAPIALMVTRLGLHELVAGRGSTLAVMERDLAAPWYLWVNRPEPETPYADWPPLSESADEMTVLRWYGIHLERDSACPVCGDFRGAAQHAHGIDEQFSIDLPEPPPEIVIPGEE